MNTVISWILWNNYVQVWASDTSSLPICWESWNRYKSHPSRVNVGRLRKLSKRFSGKCKRENKIRLFFCWTRRMWAMSIAPWDRCYATRKQICNWINLIPGSAAAQCTGSSILISTPTSLPSLHHLGNSLTHFIFIILWKLVIRRQQCWHHTAGRPFSVFVSLSLRCVDTWRVCFHCSN